VERLAKLFFFSRSVQIKQIALPGHGNKDYTYIFDLLTLSNCFLSIAFTMLHVQDLAPNLFFFPFYYSHHAHSIISDGMATPAISEK